jgi:hypothetical protein
MLLLAFDEDVSIDRQPISQSTEHNASPLLRLRGKETYPMHRALAPAAIVAILAAFSATEAMAAQTAPRITMPSAVELVQFGQQKGHYRQKGQYRQRGARRYTPGRRYRSAPSHYRRYAHRPADWRSRGCIMVGPVWFCG